MQPDLLFDAVENFVGIGRWKLGFRPHSGWYSRKFRWTRLIDQLTHEVFALPVRR
ncbi:hypothetical protein L838_5618 [Mycobacterium avium MAV_120709_2344]|nr:hypothetical protein L838_5618 [Mycobacterium avium MAV_120709_2344]